jgi:hypothetical protein
MGVFPGIGCVDSPGYRPEGVQNGKQETGSGVSGAPMQRMQAAELYHRKKPAESSGKAGVEQVLPF